ncbi:MAG: DNA adenine methylase [Acidimicrobiales bacterium]
MRRATAESLQPTLPFFDDPIEDQRFLSQQLITYIGNKRGILNLIQTAIETASSRLGTKPLRVLDMFSGSGIVSRLLKRYASSIVANDIESYARVISECYLTNRSEVDWAGLSEVVCSLNEIAERAPIPGFIEHLYSPADEDKISAADRVFYTRDNARRLDTYRQLIDSVPEQQRKLLLGPLLSEASVHANTAGVFKGFYKDRGTGVGKFGGSGADALTRILGTITLAPPILSRFECESEVYQLDANELVEKVGDFDIAYLDPPYNQHPYGSNYFMLNLLVHYKEPTNISPVSGIPADWTRSDYNVRSRAFSRLAHLIERVDARFVILSFNDEGFVSPQELRALLSQVGEVDEYKQTYTTFRGCRNLRDRSIHVTEHLYLIDKRT